MRLWKKNVSVWIHIISTCDSHKSRYEDQDEYTEVEIPAQTLLDEQGSCEKVTL